MFSGMYQFLCCSGLIAWLASHVWFNALLLTNISWPYLILIFFSAFAGIFWRTTRILSVFLLAFAVGALRLSALVESQVGEEFTSEPLQIGLKIERLPSRQEDRTRFQAQITFVANQYSQKLVGRRVQLSWKTEQKLEPEQEWLAWVKLRRPRGFVNPKGFDYHAWLLSNKIHGTGYVLNKKPFRRLETDQSVPSFDIYRHGLRESLFANTPDLAFAGVLKALMIGDKSGIGAQMWDVFQSTGTIHLVAISGLHVGIVAGLVFFLFRRAFVWLFSSYLQSWFWGRAIPALMSTVFAFIYAGLAGFSVPTQRALIFICLANIAYAFGRKTSALQLLMVTAAFVCFNEPMAFVTQGFWLSFAATFFLICAFSSYSSLSKPSIGSRLYSVIQTQWIALIALMAPMVLMGLPVSIISPLTNIIAVPLVSLLIVPVTLAGGAVSYLSMEVAQLLLRVADLAVGLMWIILVWFDSWSMELWVPNTGLSLPLACFLASVMLITPGVLGLRPLGCVVLLTALAISLSKQTLPLVRVLDVGQGLAISLHGGNNQVVYDTGARLSPTFDMGSRVIAPYLRSQGVNELDLLFISHLDNDHAGGFDGLNRILPIHQIIGGQDLAHLTNKKHVSQRCYKGQRWVSEDMVLKVFWPIRSGPSPDSTNDHSCVVFVDFQGISILLTGDISREVEYQLLASKDLPRNIDILIAPHHGSRTSSSLAFIRYLNPKHVVFSTGFGNRYRHPAKDVDERYRIEGVRRWNTATNGAVTIKKAPGEKGFEIYGERQFKPKPWFTESDNQLSK